VSRACVFLDRDGVINVKPPTGEYLRTWSEFQLLPNITDWIRIFNALDYLVIVVTNQRGVALGLTRQESIDEIHRNMIALLAAAGARIDDVFCCPHAENSCNCRKPKPGLVESARAKWDIDLGRSLLIGDSLVDEELARNTGVRFLYAEDGHLRPAELL
jgi:D-glycero-D-manno-heptose 1,7-bisphosphate phosphatase